MLPRVSTRADAKRQQTKAVERHIATFTWVAAAARAERCAAPELRSRALGHRKQRLLREGQRKPAGSRAVATAAGTRTRRRRRRRGGRRQ